MDINERLKALQEANAQLEVKIVGAKVRAFAPHLGGGLRFGAPNPARQELNVLEKTKNRNYIEMLGLEAQLEEAAE